MIRFGFLFCLWILTFPVISQERSLEQMIEDQAYSDDTREDEDDLQQLQQYRHRPLDLNKAGRDELSLIAFLSGQQIEQFLMYRSLLGPLHHVLELQAVPGWDAGLVRRILPFVQVRQDLRLGEMLREQLGKSGHTFLFRTSSGRSPALLLRYRMRSPMLETGLTIEKDKGEKLFQPGKGISFVSGNMAYRGPDLLRQLIVGDFLVNMGQGLLLWQGRAFRKSGSAVMVKRQLPVFQPYRSHDENRFMRGMAVSFGRGKIGADVFISRNLQDANTRTDSPGRSVVTSLLYTGVHRTAAELADKNSLIVLSTGGSLRYTSSRLKLALNAVSHGFSIARQKGDEPYQIHEWEGRSLTGIGLSYHYTVRNMHWFGESSAGGKGNALLQGLMFAADRKLDLAVLWRSVGPGHRSFGSSAFMESSTVNNEDGVYLGLCWRLSGTMTLEMYSDHFRSRWLRYRVGRPSYGNDHLAQLIWQPDKRSRIMLRWKQETKMEDHPSSSVFSQVDPVTRQTFRFHAEHQVSRGVEWRARLEWVTRTGQTFPEHGFAFYTDLFLKPKQAAFSGNLRLMGFQTDSYNTRVYAYEHDVMYYGPVIARYGRGAVAYLNGRWQPVGKMDLCIKYQHSWSADGHASLIRLQLVYSW